MAITATRKLVIHRMTADCVEYIGRRARCSRGILGTVESVTVEDGRPLFRGKTDDGKPWQTVNPTWVEAGE